MPGFKEYQMMFQLSATTSSQFQSAFTGAQQSIMQLQGKIDALNKQQSDITAYTKQQQAVEKTKAKLETLKQQYDNLKAAQDKAGGSDVDLQNKMLDKQLQIDKTNASLDQQTQKLDKMGAALDEAGVDTNNLASESQRLDAELGNLKQEQEDVADSAQQMGQSLNESVSAMQEALVAAGVVDILKEIGEGLKQCADAAIQYESAMAGVKRTVGGSDSFIEGLGEDFKVLSTQIPISAEELASIATTAGQLGIAQNNVEEFTRVMAQLATTTDLTADDAATMLAQFANITGTTDYERLGSTVAQLGDSTATTASKVVAMSQGMAAAATQAGFSERDIIAVSAAVGSLGIEAQAGSTAMSTLISTLYKATETGDKLDEFAAVAGMTGEQFKQAWGEDAVGTMNAFIQGLNDVDRNGKSAIVTLSDLGITNVRQQKAILGLASSGDLLSNTITQANEAWTSNTALAEKAGVMYGTTEARMTMMQNAANNVKVAIGDALTPAIGGLADVATGLLQPVAEFIEKNPAIVQALTVAAGIIGTVTGVVLGLSAALKVASAAAAMFQVSLGPIFAITAAVAALAAGVVLLTAAINDAGVSFQDLDEQYDSLIADYEEQQHILDLIDEYRSLSDELENVSDQTENLGDSSGEIKVSATADAELTSEDFMSPDDPGITLTAQQIADKLESGFMAENDDGITLSAEQTADLLASGFMDPADGGIELTAEQKAELEAMGFLVNEDGTVTLSGDPEQDVTAEDFMSPDDAGITLTAEQTRDLLAAGFLSPDDAGILLSAQADDSALLESTDFVQGDGTIELTPELGNLEALNQQLVDLGGKVSGVKSDLSSAQSTLSTMQTDYHTLELQMLSTNDTKEKSALLSQMEELSGAISDQQDEVDSLQSEYDTLNAEYEETQAAVDTINEKEARLAEIKGELAAASGGVITATEGETAAFNDELDTLEALTKAKQAELRAQIYDNASDQAEQYAKAVANNNDLLEQQAPWLQRIADTEKFVGMNAEEVNATYKDMLRTYDEMAASPTFDPASEEAQNLMRDINALNYLMGNYFSDLSEYADGSVSLFDNFGYYETDNRTLQDQIAYMDEMVAQYGGQIAENQELIDGFTNNLIDGVKTGVITLQEAEGIVNRTLGSVENGGELTTDIMAQVNAALEEASDTTEEYADATDGAADSALDLQNAVQPIIDQMDELSEAYTKAYESALDSAEGQFDLFEKINKVKVSPQFVNTGENSMREGLESQAKYWEEYATMLEQAKERGVNGDLLSELADGSEESLATLKRLNAESTSDEDIEALNASYELAQQRREEFATTAADIQTDFTNTMDGLQQQMTETVSNMDLSSEAASSAQSTFSAMVTSAEGALPAVQAAYQAIADAANRALSSIHAPEITLPGTDGPQYAEGTDSAAPGLAMVGEHGPELVMMHGGEQVFTADETAAILSKANSQEEALPISAQMAGGGSPSYNVSLSPVYNISGNANASDIEAILRAHDDELMDMMEARLHEIEVDNARRSYV